jgi:hypothetical protein
MSKVYSLFTSHKVERTMIAKNSTLNKLKSHNEHDHEQLPIRFFDCSSNEETQENNLLCWSHNSKFEKHGIEINELDL